MFKLADVNSDNEIDENSDELHRQSTFNNGLQQLSGYLFLLIKVFIGATTEIIVAT
jgi:hypothetical protein